MANETDNKTAVNPNNPVNPTPKPQTQAGAPQNAGGTSTDPNDKNLTVQVIIPKAENAKGPSYRVLRGKHRYKDPDTKEVVVAKSGDTIPPGVLSQRELDRFPDRFSVVRD